MADTKHWQHMGIIDGVGAIRFQEWGYFIEYVHKEMLDYNHYIWRGQRHSNWQLKTTLDRLMDEVNIDEINRPNFRSSQLEQFKYSVRGRRGPNPVEIKSDNEWWALGQHHGLKTPLLDWTTSPFAAAYFAFISTSQDQSENRVVFALNRPDIEGIIAEIKFKATMARFGKEEKVKKEGLGSLINLSIAPEVRPEVEFIRPQSDENQRLVNQSGLFSRAPDGINLDDWVSDKFKGSSDGYTLMKLLIPNKDRTDCLRTLNRMNINHLTLFPDLYGASKYCNLYGEIDKY